MAKKYLIRWYENSDEIRKAFLYNLRDADVKEGGHISKGSLISGSTGYVVAENNVIGYSAQIAEFKPTRHCKWQELILPCMVSPNTPPGKTPASKLRNCNYIVAQITSEEVFKMAATLSLPITKLANGSSVINLEIGSFEKQGKERKATLLP